MKTFCILYFLGLQFCVTAACCCCFCIPHIPDSTWMIGIPTVKVRWCCTSSGGKMALITSTIAFSATRVFTYCVRTIIVPPDLASYKQRVVVAVLQLLLEGRINVRRIDKPQENRTVKGIFSLSSLINIRLMSVPAAAKYKAVCIYGEVVQPKKKRNEILGILKNIFEKPLQLPQDVFGNNYHQRFSWHHCRFLMNSFLKILKQKTLFSFVVEQLYYLKKV